MAVTVYPPVCLFLLALLIVSWPMGAAAAAVLPVPEGLVWKDSKELVFLCFCFISQYLQVPADIRRSELISFLSGLTDWASRLNEEPLSRQKLELSPRQERATLPQPLSREKAPCKNFFWKTFSSC